MEPTLLFLFQWKHPSKGKLKCSYNYYSWLHLIFPGCIAMNMHLNWITVKSVKFQLIEEYIIKRSQLHVCALHDGFNFLHLVQVIMSGRWILESLWIYNALTGVTNNQSESFNATLKRLQSWHEVPVDVIILSLYHLKHFTIMKFREDFVVRIIEVLLNLNHDTNDIPQALSSIKLVRTHEDSCPSRLSLLNT